MIRTGDETGNEFGRDQIGLVMVEQTGDGDPIYALLTSDQNGGAAMKQTFEGKGPHTIPEATQYLGIIGAVLNPLAVIEVTDIALGGVFAALKLDRYGKIDDHPAVKVSGVKVTSNLSGGKFTVLYR